jgi:hypothetical protein
MNRIFGICFGLVALLMIGGCSRYYDEFEYIPRPAMASVPATQPQQTPPVSALVNVVGVRRSDGDNPLSIEVRFQIQNNSQQSVTFDPKSMVLADGSLMNFPPAVGVSPQPIVLAPSQVATFSVYFPFPPGHYEDNTDLETLQMHWTVQVDGQAVGQNVYFSRVANYYYYHRPYSYYDDPYPGPAVYFWGPPIWIGGRFGFGGGGRGRR